MQTTELNPAQIAAAAAAIPEDTPFTMLNLVRFRERADYGDRDEFPARSGQEAYLQGYAPAFNQVASKSEITSRIHPVFLGDVLAHLVGPASEQWHAVVLVEYPSFAAFRTVVESPEYLRDADPHRKAALEDWRLIALLEQKIG